MYNPQLNTFYIAATSGSFTKAAKQLFITPSAVLQQINSLENDLGVTLFYRGNHGLKLTEAGSYLLRQVKRMMEWNSSIRSTLKQLDGHSSDTLRVGVPKMHKSRCFFELWTKYCAVNHTAKFEFVEATASSGPDIAATYSSLDLIEFIDLPFTWQTDLSFFKLGETPVLVGVPVQHPYYEFDILTAEQLHSQKLIVCDGPLYEALREYLNSLTQYGFELQLVPAYTQLVLERAVFDNSLILLPGCSKNVHPRINTIQITPQFHLPYGFFYSPAAEDFIDFVKAQIAGGEFVWQE